MYKTLINNIFDFITIGRNYLDENGNLRAGEFMNDNALDLEGIYQTAIRMQYDMQELEDEIEGYERREELEYESLVYDW